MRVRTEGLGVRFHPEDFSRVLCCVHALSGDKGQGVHPLQGYTVLSLQYTSALCVRLQVAAGRHSCVCRGSCRHAPPLPTPTATGVAAGACTVSDSSDR
eukprot:scaffold19803_cov64-Phaeocystis_antarctica.AAC.1